jgi:hypothetical protein
LSSPHAATTNGIANHNSALRIALPLGLSGWIG